MAAARAAAEGIAYMKEHKESSLHSLQEWHAMIR